MILIAEIMGWPEAVASIVAVAAFALVMCVINTGKWPWEKD